MEKNRQNFLFATLYLATVNSLFGYSQTAGRTGASQSVYWLYPKYMFNWTLVSMKRLKKPLNPLYMRKSHPGVWVYSTDHRGKALSSFTLNSAISSSLIKKPAFVFVLFMLFVLGNIIYSS